MKDGFWNKCYQITLIALLLTLISLNSARADKAGWKRKEVDWRLSGGSKIKAIYYPEDEPVPILSKPKARRTTLRKEQMPVKASRRFEAMIEQPVMANVVSSPPIDGFVPYITVAVTDKRHPEILTKFEAVPSNTIRGNYLTANPEEDYAIGIFDTGASAHVMGNQAATQAGIFAADLVTSNTISISGVTGSVNAWVSQPLGIYIDGLGAIGPGGLDDSNMVGEWNVAIAVGTGGSPDLPTAIGSPLSVYYTAEFQVEQTITVTRGSEDFNAPDIRFYNKNDPCIPDYSNIIPLELRPLGGINVQYIPLFNLITLEFEPNSPSIIVGNLSQSVFFVHSIDLYEADESALDKDRFMFDTGAQVSVIGSRIGSRLRLDPDYPDFEVKIVGVTGGSIMAPGFYIDSLEIPAFGEWLIATNVPVVYLDVFSPEGGTIDGIIGMNLFTEFNFVFRGGGLFLQDEPSLAYESFTRIIADIAPEGGDGVVDYLDLDMFVEAWLSTGNTMPPSENWNPLCDMAPQPTPDGLVNLCDYAVLAEHWLETAEP